MEEGGKDRGTSPGSVLQKRRVDSGTRKMYIAHHATSYENILDRGLSKIVVRKSASWDLTTIGVCRF